LSQYRAGFPTGSLWASTTFSASSPPVNFTNADVRNFLLTNINNDLLSRPTSVGNMLYMVITQSGSSDPVEGLGGEHSVATDNHSNKFHFGWTVNDGTIDTVSNVFSHELVEAMTDAEGTALQVNPRNANSWNE